MTDPLDRSPPDAYGLENLARLVRALALDELLEDPAERAQLRRAQFAFYDACLATGLGPAARLLLRWRRTPSAQSRVISGDCSDVNDQEATVPDDQFTANPPGHDGHPGTAAQ